MSREPNAPENLDVPLDDADLDVTANLLRAARPTLDTSLRDRLLFEAGRTADARGRSRRTTAWATAACLFAATTIGLIATRPVGTRPPIADRTDVRPNATDARTEIVRRPAPEASPVLPERDEPRLLRAGDRRLDAIPPTNHEPLALGPGEQRQPLTPIRGWSDLDSI